MSQTLVVSSRGQITLPAATRKRLGIKGGDHVILEDRGGEIVLKPAWFSKFSTTATSRSQAGTLTTSSRIVSERASWMP